MGRSENDFGDFSFLLQSNAVLLENCSSKPHFTGRRNKIVEFIFWEYMWKWRIIIKGKRVNTHMNWESDSESVCTLAHTLAIWISFDREKLMAFRMRWLYSVKCAIEFAIEINEHEQSFIFISRFFTARSMAQNSYCVPFEKNSTAFAVAFNWILYIITSSFNANISCQKYINDNNASHLNVARLPLSPLVRHNERPNFLTIKCMIYYWQWLCTRARTKYLLNVVNMSHTVWLAVNHIIE